MSTNIEKTQEALEMTKFIEQEEPRIEEARRNFEEQQRKKAVHAQEVQAKKEEDVFRFVEPRKSKSKSVSAPKVSKAKPATAISPASISESEPVVSTLSKQDDIVVGIERDGVFIPFKAEDDVFSVDAKSKSKGDYSFAAEDLEIEEDPEVVIMGNDSDDDSLALELHDRQDLSDEDDYLLVEEEPEFIVSDFESEPASVKTDYKFALALHLAELQQVSNLSKKELAEYAHSLRAAYDSRENADGKNLNVEKLSEAAQREAHCQNLSGKNYTFFANTEKASTEPLHIHGSLVTSFSH